MVRKTLEIKDLEPGQNYSVQVRAANFDENIGPSNWSLALNVTTAVDSTPPGKPSMPNASNDTQSVLVTHDLLLDNGDPFPPDASKLLVYASTSGTLLGNNSEYLGSMTIVPRFGAAVQKFPLPNNETTPNSGNPETWFIAIRVVDSTGNESPLSGTVQASPTLIESSQILSLTAEKIAANSAFINKLFIRDEIEVDSSGYLVSSNFNGSTANGSGASTGWWLGDAGLTIATGDISGVNITGSVFQTATSGNRIKIWEDGPEGKIEFYDSANNIEAAIRYDDVDNRLEIDGWSSFATEILIQGDGLILSGYLSAVVIQSSFGLLLDLGGGVDVNIEPNIDLTSGDGIFIQPVTNPPTDESIFEIRSSGGTSRFEVWHNGPVYARGGYRLPNGTETNPSLKFADNAGIYQEIPDQVNMAINGINEFAIGAVGLLVPNVYNQTGTGTTVVVDSTGLIRRSSSSLRYKTDIEYLDLSDDLPDFEELNPARFRKLSGDTRTPIDMKPTDVVEYGFIAEDVADIFPEAAIMGEDGQVEDYNARSVMALMALEMTKMRSRIKELENANI